MSFTFSSTCQTDYLAIGACDICAVRLTSGCEHSNDENHQEWLAAHLVAEAGSVNEDAFITLIAFAEACDTVPNPAEIAFDLEALPLAEQVAAEVENDSRWLDSDSVSESWQAEAMAEHADWLDAKSTEENARM